MPDRLVVMGVTLSGGFKAVGKRAIRLIDHVHFGMTIMVLAWLMTSIRGTQTNLVIQLS